MKNQVVIILDTEAEFPIQIGKMQNTPPLTPSDLDKAITLDFSTISEAIFVLIKEMEKMKIQSHEASIKHLIEGLEKEFPGTFTVE